MGSNPLAVLPKAGEMSWQVQDTHNAHTHAHEYANSNMYARSPFSSPITPENAYGYSNRQQQQPTSPHFKEVHFEYSADGKHRYRTQPKGAKALDMRVKPYARKRTTSESSDGSTGAVLNVDPTIKEELLHRCVTCGKVYKHESCLLKHNWEHTEYWELAKQHCASKHQSVQLLEAARILVKMQ
eukprot:comp14582_c0_seq1/m.10849 comp14582_c0_seq1/g.10849  ORF comp14582_c0_seq1/g.10849 comp14582_c0_seq1/m.10849 type:complete len:184 (-) comp14582_c0_seq1:137-688(-)